MVVFGERISIRESGSSDRSDTRSVWQRELSALTGGAPCAHAGHRWWLRITVGGERWCSETPPLTEIPACCIGLLQIVTENTPDLKEQFSIFVLCVPQTDSRVSLA